MYEGGLATILSGLDRLASMGVIDRAKVGISGLSAGAKWTSYAVARSRAFAVASVAYVIPSPLSASGVVLGRPDRRGATG